MPRYLSSPTRGEYNPNVRPIQYGGTGATTPAQAAINLGAVTASSVGQPNGPVPLDANRKVAVAIETGSILSGLNIFGPKVVPVSTTRTYVITDHNVGMAYTVTAIRGAAVVNGDTITYTAPATTGNAGFVLNGRTFVVNVQAATPAKPTIITPVNTSSGLATSVTVSSSAFATTSASVSDTHLSSDWELHSAATGAFLGVASRALSDDTVNKTTWSITGLKPNTLYGVRVRYKGTLTGLSEWSDYSYFTTAP